GHGAALVCHRAGTRPATQQDVHGRSAASSGPSIAAALQRTGTRFHQEKRRAGRRQGCTGASATASETAQGAVANVSDPEIQAVPEIPSAPLPDAQPQPTPVPPPPATTHDQ